MSPGWAWAQKRKKKKSQRFPTSVSSMALRQLAQRAGLQV
jgi:hypothetical protein